MNNALCESVKEFSNFYKNNQYSEESKWVEMFLDNIVTEFSLVDDSDLCYENIEFDRFSKSIISYPKKEDNKQLVKRLIFTNHFHNFKYEYYLSNKLFDKEIIFNVESSGGNLEPRIGVCYKYNNSIVNLEIKYNNFDGFLYGEINKKSFLFHSDMVNAIHLTNNCIRSDCSTKITSPIQQLLSLKEKNSNQSIIFVSKELELLKYDILENFMVEFNDTKYFKDYRGHLTLPIYMNEVDIETNALIEFISTQVSRCLKLKTVDQFPILLLDELGLIDIELLKDEYIKSNRYGYRLCDVLYHYMTKNGEFIIKFTDLFDTSENPHKIKSNSEVLKDNLNKITGFCKKSEECVENDIEWL